MDIQNISQKHMHFPISGNRYRQKKYRVKDSLLLVIVFLIGLIGSCYILHFALSRDNNPTGYEMDINHEHTSTADLAMF